MSISKDAELGALSATVGRMDLCHLSCGRIATHRVWGVPPVCAEHVPKLQEAYPGEEVHEMPNMRLVRRFEQLLRGE